MRKINTLLALSAAFFCAACQTTNPPPKWWNPGGKYSGESAPAAQTTPPAEVPPDPNIIDPVKEEIVEIIRLDPPSVLSETSDEEPPSAE